MLLASAGIMCFSSWMHFVKLLLMSLTSVLGSDVRYYRQWEKNALFSCRRFRIFGSAVLVRLCSRVCHPNNIRVNPSQASASLLGGLSPEFNFELSMLLRLHLSFANGYDLFSQQNRLLNLTSGLWLRHLISQTSVRVARWLLLSHRGVLR